MELKEETVKHEGIVIGSQFTNQNWLCFFGNANCSLALLQKTFPNFEFRSLTQIHGDLILESQTQNLEADGHWTRSHQLALLIRTADCLPIMLATNQRVIALHAGWRGIELNLIKKVSELMLPDESPVIAIIGPHIQAPQFEVRTGVADQLIATYRRSSPHGPLPFLNHPDPEKKRINLGAIARVQLENLSHQSFPIIVSRTCTFLSPDFHSFRRNQSAAGRQYSFIVKLS